MSVKSEKAEELRREKARNLRYKKAIHAEPEPGNHHQRAV